MIADSMVCQDTVVHCTDPDEEFKFAVKGPGEIYTFNRKCRDILA